LKSIILVLGLMLFSLHLSARQTVEDSTHFRVQAIEITGNNKTKEQTILNELSFSLTRKYSKNQLTEEFKKSKDNLLRTPLFHSVNFYARYDSAAVYVEIEVSERWYLWPEVVLTYADQNFSNWIKNREFLRSNFGLGLMKFNFRGRNEKISFFAMAGYDQLFMTEYTGIKLDKKGRHTISLYFRTAQRKETPACIINDTLRYYHAESDFAIREYSSFVNYSYRPNISMRHHFRLGFRSRQISDSLSELNPDYLPGNTNKIQYTYLRYSFEYDTRDSRAYAQSGNHISLSAEKTGLHIFSGSEASSVYARLRYTNYTTWGESIVLQSHISIKTSFGSERAFFLNNALGSSNVLSGYEYYTANGSSYLFLQHRLSTKLLDTKIHLKFIPLKQFNTIPGQIYFQLHFGYGQVKNINTTYLQKNRLINENLYSAGIGLIFVSYYDKLMRLEYSINHLKEHGFFIHFEMPF
jgi:outer membrane protein assembly factor BamA